MNSLRRIYQVLALLAVLHVAVLAGLGGFLWMRGTINVERIGQIAAVLRGEADHGEELVVDATSNGAPSPPDVSPDEVARQQAEEEIARFKSQRVKEELEQQLALVTREMLRVREERDRFEAQQAREAEAAKKKSEQVQQAGFQKQLQYFESLKPALALELMLGREDEEAADLLKSMDTRKGRKIIEAAKTPQQKKKLDSIMRLLPELNAIPVSAEPAGNPSKASP